MDDLYLRTAEPADASAIESIYRPYVETTAVTFETEPPDAASIAEEIQTRLETYPYFVAASDADGVLGYAYAGRLRKRDAYRWAAELSVYLDGDYRRQGVGSALYTALLDTLDRQGFNSAYGVVTLPNPESVGFHESLGFDRVGRFPEVGYKLGAWHDVAWYKRSLGDRSDAPTEPVAFERCRDEPWLRGLSVDAAACDFRVE